MGDDAPVGELWPAVAVCVVWLLALGLADVWLIRRGHRPVTDVARHPAGQAFRRYFDGHVDRTLALDLFSIAGARVGRKAPA